MKGSEAKLTGFMEGHSKRFVIPVYQRNYDWKTENCKQLFDDLEKVIKKNRNSHFFGSIVHVYNPDGRDEEYQIIDGQQRLTTVSLLFLAMYNLMNEGKMKADDDSLMNMIYECYLVDKFRNDDTRIKLKPVKNDKKAFDQLFKDENEYILDSNLTANYKYFYERIQNSFLSIDDLYKAIKRLEIIDIKLNQDDNPQLIFESLNSTGLALSEGDKIRNLILMGLSIKAQEDYYENYWNKIEQHTNYNVSDFIRDYLSVKQKVIPSKNKVYFAFKNYVEDNDYETEELLKELLDYAKRYGVLLRGNTNNRQLNACIKRLNRLQTTVTRPFFLEVLRLNEGDNPKLNIDDVEEIFRYTENYLFRRSICDLPTAVLNKIFLYLHNEIFRYEKNEENYVEKFKYALISKPERSRFPDDGEFTKDFSEKQLYLMNSKNKVYALERFENYGILEDKDIYRHLDDGDYSIEHIMPQHLTTDWIDDLGENYEEIHDVWLHRLANLTLTGYNSKYSNNRFNEKKTMEKGFKESGLRLNTYLCGLEKWGLQELIDRDDYLMKRALEIWSMPETDFKPPVKELDSYTLADDEEELKGRYLIKYSFKNTEVPVESWIEMYEQMLRIINQKDGTLLPRLAYANPDEVELAQYFSSKESDLRMPSKISDNLYFDRNLSTRRKVIILRQLLEKVDESPEDLVFYLRDEREQEIEAGSRFERRLKYWTSALDKIKEANRVDGQVRCFSNVNPSKNNWISGFFGVGGINISCIANEDKARVEIWFGKSDAQANKQLFDQVFRAKDIIEKELDAELIWNRNNEYKSSSIGIENKGLSVSDEDSWERMADFHAKWSRAFYDIIVPYIKGEK